MASPPVVISVRVVGCYAVYGSRRVLSCILVGVCQARAVVTKPRCPSRPDHDPGGKAGCRSALREIARVRFVVGKYRRITRARARRRGAGTHGEALVRHRGSHRVARLLTDRGVDRCYEWFPAGPRESFQDDSGCLGGSCSGCASLFSPAQGSPLRLADRSTRHLRAPLHCGHGADSH